MNNSIYTGIDIGSKNLKFMSISYNLENDTTKILYKKSYSSKGITDGYISNPDLFNQIFLSAIKNYKKETGISIDDVILTIDSCGLKSQTLKITHNVVNQSYITEVDIDEIKRKINIIAHREIKGEIIESKLIKYTINDYEYFSDTEGLQSKKIEAEFIFIFLPKNHISILEKILIKNDISLLDLKSGNLVSAEINLEKEDKNLGIINIDIGSDKTSLSV
ncbi:Cell division protein ftsA [sediment metagenome]|uniref:Cell division protein ftsA n=1 Tax=sediment metagenome TaxID=749907 RepID=D9PM86_9ZZZZ